MKFAVVHPTLTAAETIGSEHQAQDRLDAIQRDTLIPGFIRVVPDPIEPTAAIHRPWEKPRRRFSALARLRRS